jgi:hypothetical protein
MVAGASSEKRRWRSGAAGSRPSHFFGRQRPALKELTVDREDVKARDALPKETGRGRFTKGSRWTNLAVVRDVEI